jgi:hypothetical protein
MISGYASQISVHRGDTAVVNVATDAPRFHARFLHVGASLELVATSPWFRGRMAPAAGPDDDWDWPAYSIEIERDWPAGAYVVVLATDEEGEDMLDGRAGRLLLLVSRDRPAPILFKVPVSTYNAYNYSGGGSLYWNHRETSTGYVVSFRRPGIGVGGAVTELEDAYDPSTPRQTFGHWDAPFLQWMAAEGFDFDVCSDLDLADASALDEVRLVVSAGHDEYWTEAVRDATEAFVAGGGNLAIFGGNTCWWRTLVDAYRLVCDKRALPSGPAADEWRAIRPVADLIGVSYENGGGWWDGEREAVGYEVLDSSSWVFDGTDLRTGDIFGAEERLVGYECDGSDLYRQAGSASGGFHALAVGPLGAGWNVVPHRAADTPHAATMGILEGRGIVFNAATTDWARLVATERSVARISRNVLGRLGHALKW